MNKMEHRLRTWPSGPRWMLACIGVLWVALSPGRALADSKDDEARKVCRKLSADECCNAAWSFFHGKNGMEQDRQAAQALFKESCRLYKKTKRGEIAAMCCSMVSP